MAKFVKSTYIEAPVEKVFDFMDDPYLLREVWPNMSDVSDVQRLPNGGVCYKYLYAMAGFRLPGTSEDTEHIPNVRTVSKSTGGVDSVATVDFSPTGSGTTVTITTEFNIPFPVLGKLAEAVVVKMSEQDGEMLLSNLKKKLEV